MSALSEQLTETICELQALPSLSASLLGGGTSLAIRYQHRQSLDIDLFFPGIIGKNGFELIRTEVRSLYGEAAFRFEYPCEIDDQFIFLRFYVKKGDLEIKVEILQNMQTYLEPDILDGVRLMHEQDVALLKLMAAANRASPKDIYDLDYITENLPLTGLMTALAAKQMAYAGDEHRSIFDLEGEKSPVPEPELLLKFEETAKAMPAGHPIRATVSIRCRIRKNWLAARSGWRRKVRVYFRSTGREFPASEAS